MILLDTNVIIDMLNNESDPNWSLLKKDDVVICGMIITELYRGIKNKKEGKAVELFVNSVSSLPLSENDWKEIGLFIAELKKNGLVVPVQDAIISFLAIKFNCSVVSRDKHFSLIQAADNRLVLA